MGWRFVVPRWLDITIKIVQILGAVAFFAYTGLFFHYAYTLSTIPNQSAGKIYPLNMHGYVVYLNHLQHLRLEICGTLAVCFGTIFGLTAIYIIYRQEGQH